MAMMQGHRPEEEFKACRALILVRNIAVPGRHMSYYWLLFWRDWRSGHHTASGNANCDGS